MQDDILQQVFRLVLVQVCFFNIYIYILYIYIYASHTPKMARAHRLNKCPSSSFCRPWITSLPHMLLQSQSPRHLAATTEVPGTPLNCALCIPLEGVRMTSEWDLNIQRILGLRPVLFLLLSLFFFLNDPFSVFLFSSLYSASCCCLMFYVLPFSLEQHKHTVDL